MVSLKASFDHTRGHHLYWEAAERIASMHYRCGNATPEWLTVGGAGCGKSTLLNILSGEELTDEGNAYVGGTIL